MNLIAREPVVTGIVGLVATFLTVLTAFGVEFTDEQSAAVLGFVGALLALAVLLRSQVTPTSLRAA